MMIRNFKLWNEGKAPRHGLLVFAALVFCGVAAEAQVPDSRWTPGEIQLLAHWVEAAPEDALPVLDTSALDAAVARPDRAAIDAAATALALRLARMHLLGCATQAERAGWRIEDSDASVVLEERLARAVAMNSVDSFFAGLQPKHSDYAALRSAYATETDPARRKTLARNMERWRWMPQSLGEDYLFVNAASFEASLWKDGQRAGTWRVIVGKRSTPSPVFSAMVTGVTYNPWWYIPASIVREKRGNFPARLGYVRTASGYAQKPGPNNALGQMKLVMPNPFNVYLHDTPGKKLFDEDVRAFSHGCIRVDDALGFAAALLRGTKNREEADAIVAGRKTVTVDLLRQLPVYVTYFTAGVADDGSLAVRPNIYGRDGRMSDAANSHRPCAAQG